MNFKDFEKNIDSQFLERGISYFRNGHVLSFEETDKGLWEAEVEGSVIYNVSISTNKNEIKRWDCDCPYDSGPICKHVIAVLYAISDYLKNEKKKPEGKRNQKETDMQKIKKIFEKISKEELMEFVTEQFKNEKKLKNYFLAYFADSIEEETDIKYKTLIRNLVKISSGRYGFVDYRNASNLINSLSEMIKKSIRIFHEGKVPESLVICKSMIEELPEILNNIDDSGGGMRELIDDTFQIFSMIAFKAPPLLKEELFNYCIYEFQKDKYKGFEIDYNLLEVIPGLITTEEEEKIFFELIDKQILIEKKKDSYYFSEMNLIEAKINYLRKNQKHTEAYKIIEENIHYPDFRKIIVVDEIKKKDFKKAKELCMDGIEISESNKHPGTSRDWYEILLDIAGLEKNMDDIRNWNEKLFLGSSFEMKYYINLKSTYNESEWQEELEKIIKKILKGKNRYYYTEALANIYIEEKSFDKLLELVKKNSSSIYFIDRYSKYLKDLYPEELIILYVNAIIDKALITDVKVYEDVAGYMNNLNKIKGSEIKLKELLNYFRTVYRNRRRMMEILDKNFPDL